MLHRGPDAAGIYISDDRRVGLGFRRLAIVDLSPAGNQPMSNEDGSIWMVFNGEIYNHRKLRPGLIERGHRYRSETDSETIIHLYEEKGLDFVNDLEGMFAIAIWDSIKRQLILARDRIGVKPLYYARQNGQIIFGSEIKAILQHPSIERDVDETALYHYLTFLTTPSPQTLFRGIEKLPPGHLMICDRQGNLTVKRYWNAIVPRREKEPTEQEAIETIRRLLKEAIEKRMMADVPFGVFLSGGIDSSANVALMAECMSAPARTFTVGFRDAPAYNELDYARQVAQRFQTDHHEVIIGREEVIDFLPQLIFHQDEPIADPVCVPLYYVSQLARDSGTIVVQVGEGSDEIFSGYSNYIDFLRIHEKFWRYASLAPGLMKKAVVAVGAPLAPLFADAFLPRGKKILPDLLRRFSSGEELFWGGAVVYDEVSKRNLISTDFRRRLGALSSYGVVKGYLDEIDREKPGADFLERMIYLELKLRLAELLLMRVDKITMATSIEARVPFLDHKLVEYAMSLPRHFKYRNGQGKYILKKALEGTLPHNIIYRQKKGFGLPINEWFISGMGDFVEAAILASPIRKRGYFNYEYIKELLAAHRSGRINYSFHLWCLLNLSLWYEHWIEGAQRAQVVNECVMRDA